VVLPSASLILYMQPWPTHDDLLSIGHAATHPTNPALITHQVFECAVTQVVKSSIHKCDRLAVRTHRAPGCSTQAHHTACGLAAAAASSSTVAASSSSSAATLAAGVTLMHGGGGAVVLMP
jgi:hypothetical protein